MKRKMYYLVIIALILGALLWSSCGKEPSYEDRETFAPEILTPVEGTHSCRFPERRDRGGLAERM